MSTNIVSFAAAARRKAAVRAACLLLTWRQARGLSQPEAARELGASVRVYGDWERGVSKMPAEVLVMINDADWKVAA